MTTRSAALDWPPTELVVDPADAGRRLDVWLAERLPAFSRERVRVLLALGRVRVDGVARRTGVRLAAGVAVRVTGIPPATAPLPVANPALTLPVVHTDPWLYVVDKPAGLPTVPLGPDDLHSVASALVAMDQSLRGIGPRPLEPGLLHRLDNGTSGLLLVARTPASYAALAAALDRDEVEKCYTALVVGDPGGAGEVTWPIAHAADRTRMEVVRDPSQAAARHARPACTRLRVLERRGAFSLVEARITSGARHQIRVHLAALGHPLAGDELYGGPPGPTGRHFLHASRIELAHPGTGEGLVVESGLAMELREWLQSPEGSILKRR